MPPFEAQARQLWRQMGAPLCLDGCQMSHGSYLPQLTDAQSRRQWAVQSRMHFTLSARDASAYARVFPAEFDQETGELIAYAWRYGRVAESNFCGTP